ncbi:MAG: phosphoglycerate dehydrogenase [Clostridiales bacterium]|jgi:D-3-phosphoglycerate dehydrogenase|nr:phosphoglycerate dehydrogenase [Clostridiales bacterium]
MMNIRTLNPIADSIFDYLEPARYAVSGDAASPVGILVRSADCRDMEFGPELLAIARAGAGVNNIPLERCARAGIAVFNTPGANANAVNELALCCMLMVSRNVIEGVEWVNKLTGADIPLQVEQGKRRFLGHELAGKTLAVIGLGAIGVMVANDAHAIGMRVIGYDPYVSIEHAWGLSRAIHRGNSLEEILPQCDYVSVHIPLMEKTRHFLNWRAFSIMKPGAIVLNLARGELVDNAALLAAIEKGVVKKYVTDFPTEELLNRKGVVCVPHLGATTPESEENCARMAAKELDAYLRYGNIQNSVNMPQCGMTPTGSYRLCALHKNAKNMVGQISSAVAAANGNIANMINASRNEIAYTLMDLDDALPEAVTAKIQAIDGVIRIRTINTNGNAEG